MIEILAGIIVFAIVGTVIFLLAAAAYYYACLIIGALFLTLARLVLAFLQLAFCLDSARQPWLDRAVEWVNGELRKLA